jgi:VCBS repeat-containing protein
MNINVSFDQSTSSLPSGFVAAVNYVVNYFDSLFTNPITISIAVGYGEIDGQTLSSNALGESESGINGQPGYVYIEDYSQTRSALLSQNAPGASTLPSSSPASGSLAMPSAEARALGLYSSNSGVDGWVGFDSSPGVFSYSINSAPPSGEYYFVGVVEHEFTEVMGRASFLDSAPNYYGLIDLYRYSAPGARQLGTGAPSYFSVDGGNTNLDNWNNFQTGNNGDLADWAPSAGHDALDDNSNPGVINAFTATDITLMEALGWTTTAPASIAVSATTAEAVQGGAPVTLLSAAPSITDSSSATLAKATVKIANGSGNAVAGDELFVNGQQSGSLGSGVTASWNASTSTLTLSGTASIATYQTLLAEVTYQDTGTDSSSGSHPVRTVTWTVNDGSQNLSTTSRVTVDRPPVANNAAGFDPIGTMLSVSAANGVLSHDSDLDGDSLTVSAVNGVAGNVGASVAGTYGHLTLNGNGSYSYVANAGAAAGSVDSFTYTASDGNGGSATANLTITLDNALQAGPLAVLTPVGQATPSSWTLPGSGGSGTLTFTLAQAAAHGSVAVNANGTFTYTPASGYSGSDSFQYKVTDALGETSVNTVSVGVGSGYRVAQSLQLAGSQDLQAASAAGNQQTWSWSGWVDLSSLGQYQVLFQALAPNNAGWTTLRFTSGNQLEFFDDNTSAYVSHLITNQTFSANTWYQVTLVYDTTQATAANRVELFVNGQQITSFATQVDPSQNYAGYMGGAGTSYLGFDGRWSGYYLNGNLADVQFVDGQAPSAASFGASINGQWEPIAYSGSYGSNGYHLTFAAGSIGADSSGNGDNFTPVNLSAANVSSATPGGSAAQVALTLDNGVAINNGSSDPVSGATVKLTGGYAGDGDLLSVNTAGTNVTASWNAGSETLTLAGSASAATYQSLLDQVIFSSTAADPTNGSANTSRTASWQVTDATTNTLSSPVTETIDLSAQFAASHTLAVTATQSSTSSTSANASPGASDPIGQNLSLLGNYMSSGFAPAGLDGGGGTQTASPLGSPDPNQTIAVLGGTHLPSA